MTKPDTRYVVFKGASPLLELDDQQRVRLVLLPYGPVSPYLDKENFVLLGTDAEERLLFGLDVAMCAKRPPSDFEDEGWLIPIDSGTMMLTGSWF